MEFQFDSMIYGYVCVTAEKFWDEETKEDKYSVWAIYFKSEDGGENSEKETHIFFDYTIKDGMSEEEIEDEMEEIIKKKMIENNL